jgi:tetratricopeptide (TPR) repeat protein
MLAEAVALLGRGLALVRGQPDTDWRREHEFDLQIALGQALVASRGWGTPELVEVHARARQLALTLNRPRALLSILFNQFWDDWARADVRRARRLGAELRELGGAAGDVLMQMMGCQAGGMTCFHLGELTAGRAYLEKALALYDPAYRPSLSELLSHDARVFLRIFSSWLLASLGHLDQALFQRGAALDEARRLSHPPTLALALGAAGWTTGRSFAWSRDCCCSAPTTAGIRHRARIGVRSYGGSRLSRVVSGGAGTCGRGNSAHQGRRGRLARAWIQSPQAVASGASRGRRMAGEPQPALEHLAEARDLAEETEERWFQAETLRLRGDALRATGDPAAAEVSYREAMAIAQRQSAKLWELCAAMSLARLWRDQGKGTAAHELLAPVYGWFTEGFGTPVLREARALLAELAGASPLPKSED